MNTNTGSFIALAGIIVSVFQHYNISLDQNSVVSVFAAGAIVYGWIHQFIVTRKVRNLALAAGVKGIK